MNEGNRRILDEIERGLSEGRARREAAREQVDASIGAVERETARTKRTVGSMEFGYDTMANDLQGAVACLVRALSRLDDATEEVRRLERMMGRAERAGLAAAPVLPLTGDAAAWEATPAKTVRAGKK